MVDSLQLSPGAQAGGPLRLNATLSARIFTTAGAAPAEGSAGGSRVSMGALFSGEYRRAAMMGVVGAPVIVALLMLRLFAGGDGGAASTPVGPAVPASVPLSGGTLPTAPVPAPVPPVPVDPALLRNPFCPLVAAPAAAGSAPVTCERPAAPAGHQVVELVDIFEEGGVRLARMHVGQFTFSNVHEGDVVADSLRVVALSDRCGDFEFAAAPLSLCEGEQVFR